MDILKKVTPGNRKLSFVIVMVLILGAFFSLYFFKYLPASKEELNKRGFRILRQISDNISEKNSEYKTRINKIIKSPSLRDSLCDPKTRRFKDNDTIKKIIAVKFTHLNDLELKSVHRIDSQHHKFYELGDSVLETTISLKKGESWKQHYQTDCYTDSGAISISIEGDLNKYLTTIINSRKDLFETYLILAGAQNNDTGANRTGGSKAVLIYQSDNVTLSTSADYDSLLSGRGQGSISGIHTLELSGVPYVLFSKPMTWDDNNLFLVGLVKKSMYGSKYLSVSSGLIYTVCIILLILVFSLPFIKIALITAREKLLVKDVVMAGVTLILGTALIVIILTDWLLYKNLEEKKQRQLNNLSDNVQRNFEAEITAAYRQLKEFDSLVVSDGRWLLDQTAYNADSLFLHPSYYRTFDQVFWVAGDGMQQAKWETNKVATPKINLRDRNYFRRIMYGDAYEYPVGDETARFFIEPVYSNISAEFKVMLSARSIAAQKGDSLFLLHSKHLEDRAGIDSLLGRDSLLRESKVVALATRMYTEPNPILPREFGFCVIDESGKVLIHSDIKRSLLENLIEETNDNPVLRQAIKKREDRFISDVIYYGDPHELRVRPFHHLPLYLVTYFNKTDLVNTNSRIVAVTILLSLLVFAFLLLTHRIFRSRNQKLSKLNFPAGQYSWFKPQNNSVADLFVISSFILAYITLAVAFNLIDALLVAESAWVMLFNMLLIPFHTYWGIYSIRRVLPGENRKAPARYLPFFLIMAFVNLLILYYTKNDHVDDSGITRIYLHTLLFQLVSLVFIALFPRFLISQKAYQPDDVQPTWARQLFYYSRSIVLLLIAVSVLPPVTFLYYTFNEEKMQSVKTRQLQLAIDVQQRNRKMESRHKKQKKYKEAVYKTFYDSAFIRSLTKTAHIYTGDKLEIRSADQNDRVLGLSNFSFYENLLAILPGMKTVNDTSYQLKNAASDSAWYWAKSDQLNRKGISLFYNGMGEQKLPLRIDSATPLYLKSVMGVWPFAVFFIFIVTGVLYVIFRIIRYMAKTIFLIGYHESFETCSIEEAFLEKFASYIHMERIILLDDKSNSLYSREEFNGSCDIINPEHDTNPDLLAATIRKSDKRFILLNNDNAALIKGVLLRLNETPDMGFDPDEWKVTLVVRPLKLREPFRLPSELLNEDHKSGWWEKAMQSLKGRYELYEKNEYAKILHKRLRWLETRNSLSGGHSAYYNNDDYILHTQHRFEQNYEALWNTCTEQEKLILFDFAQDEFANYRNEYIIHRLIRNGMLIYENGSLRMMNDSFRNFVLTKSGSLALEEMEKGVSKSEKWDVFRISLIVLVSAVALFVFFTQEEVFQQISAALASVVALGSMLFKFMEQGKPVVSSGPPVK